MRLLAKCPQCSFVIGLELEDADKRKRCPRCGRLFKVPDLPELENAFRLVKEVGNSVFVDENGNVYG